MTRTSALLPLVVLLGIGTDTLLAETPDHRRSHIRTTDPRLHRLVDAGVQTSATFDGLVSRLQQSDVVVYLECAGTLRATAGRLTFLSSAGGHRYLRVRVSCFGSADQQIAIIGHELRHAVEIADTPDVVDARSMEAVYRRIGYVNPRLRGLAFDTDAAVRAGQAVLREMSGSAAE